MILNWSPFALRALGDWIEREPFGELGTDRPQTPISNCLFAKYDFELVTFRTSCVR